MKKLIVLLTIVAILMSTLVSCDEGQRGTSGKEKVLTYLVSAESTTYNEILYQLIDEFNAQIKDEGYRIQIEVPGGEYYQSLGNKFAAGRAPDIFMMESGYFKAYSKHLLSLDSYLESSSVLSKDDLWDLNDTFSENGEIKALIKDFSPDFMLIYNKTMLNNYNKANPDNAIEISETEPLTWEEFYEISSRISAWAGVEYGTSLGFEGIKHLHEFVQMTGSNMYTSDYKGINISDPNVREAFSFYCALQKDNATEFQNYYALNKNSGRAPGSYTSGSNTSEQELFKHQRTFSIFNGLYSFAAYDFYNTTFEVGIAPSPVMNEGDECYSTASAMVSHAISANSKYKDIAWRWLEFYQTEGLKRFAQIGFNIPGNKTIAGSDYFLKNDNPEVEAVTNYFYNYVSKGAVHATEYNSNIAFSRISTCFTIHMSKYFDGQLTFDELLDKINESVEGST